jgi:hypothetical protein
VQQI